MCCYLDFPIAFVEQCLFSRVYFWLLCQRPESYGCKDFLFYSIPMARIFLCAPCCYNYHGCSINLKSGMLMPPTIVFLFRITLAILCLLWLHIYFNTFSILCKECPRYHDWDCTDLYCVFSRVAIFAKLIIVNNKYDWKGCLSIF